MRTRRFALALAAALALPLGVGAQAHASGSAESAEFDFGACPSVEQFPTGSDPAAWRCESMRATGHLTLGSLSVPIEKPMRITFAEGRTDGAYRQVFGAMTTAPIRVPGTPWTLTTRYGGYFDFHSDDERRGVLDATFTLRGPALPRGCSIGTDERPVRLVLHDTEPTRVISQDPLVVGFGAQDRDFAVPRTTGCGPLGRLLDRVLGLPSAGGRNTIDLDATVGIRPYV